MTRSKVFTFRVNGEERKIIASLSEQLERNESDAVRWVIRQAASALEKKTEMAVSDQVHA